MRSASYWHRIQLENSTAQRIIFTDILASSLFKIMSKHLVQKIEIKWIISPSHGFYDSPKLANSPFFVERRAQLLGT